MIVPLRALLLASHGAYRALGFRSRWMRAEGRLLHLYDRTGRGAASPVLLVHGVGGHAGGFLRVLRPLLRVSRRVVALDLPGHGRSRLREGEAPATLLECAGTLKEAMRQIGEPAVLVGSSLGGALVLFAAAALPELTAAVIGLNPAGAPLAGADREAVLDAYRGDGSADFGLAALRKLYQRPPALGWLVARDLGRHLGAPPVRQLLSELEADLPGLPPQALESIDKPVLILWGEGDRILPATSVDYFRAHLRRGTVETIPDCGHLPMVEQGRRVAARIARFLAEPPTYRPARWLRGANLMTVFGPLLRPGPRVRLTRERWELSDGDFVDVDRMAGPRDAPLLLALHGLEGSSSANYIRGLLAQARERGWRALALNFRGCSGETNRLPRSYHSGETGDLDELVRRARGEADRIVIAGCSLGGNVLVKWLGEQGESAPREVKAAVALCVPFDLELCARTLDSPGFWRWVYRTRFLYTLKRKSLEKLARFPSAADASRVRKARTLFEFDDALTARVHGFSGALDYYARSSSGPFVEAVRVPLLLLSAADDPFIPAGSFPRTRNPAVTLELAEKGGHLGFVEGPIFRPRFYGERRAISFLAGRLERSAGTDP